MMASSSGAVAGNIWHTATHAEHARPMMQARRQALQFLALGHAAVVCMQQCCCTCPTQLSCSTGGVPCQILFDLPPIPPISLAAGVRRCIPAVPQARAGCCAQHAPGAAGTTVGARRGVLLVSLAAFLYTQDACSCCNMPCSVATSCFSSRCWVGMSRQCVWRPCCGWRACARRWWRGWQQQRGWPRRLRTPALLRPSRYDVQGFGGLWPARSCADG